METFIAFFDTDIEYVLVAACLGAIIGLEREIAGKDPSLRTFSLICMGSCIFSLISVHSVAGLPHADPSRVAAQIVTGIGFLGAGAIFRSGNAVRGLTTAAIIWATAAIGMAVGFKLVNLAVGATVLLLLVNYVLNFVHWLLRIIRKEHPSTSISDAEME